MKKLKQILVVAILVFCCSMVVKADTKAADTPQITGVKQVNDYTDSVTISCNPAEDTQYYAVELSQTLSDNDNDWKYLGEVTNPQEIKIPGLSAGQTYYVRVTGLLVYNDEVYMSADTSAPLEVVTAPNVSSITAVQSNASTNSATVTITATAPGANYYVLSYNNSVIGKGSSPNVTTSVPLNSGVRYSSVKADVCRISSTGYIAYGSLYRTLNITTLQSKINKTNFGVSSGNTKSDSYTFAVSSSYFADGYHFEFQTTDGKVKKNLYAKGVASVGATKLNGTFYKYRVRSYVNCASGPVYSAWSDFKTFAVTKKVTGKLQKGNKVKLSWKKVSGASGYTIYASDKNSGYKKVKSLNAKKTSLVISKIKGKKLKKGKTYYIRIVPKAKKLGNADTYYIYSGTIVTKYR